MNSINAFYDPEPNCISCLDMENWRPADFTCADCKNMLREKVEVMSLGVGFYANKAIIKLQSGELKTVSIDTITIID